MIIANGQRRGQQSVLNRTVPLVPALPSAVALLSPLQRQLVEVVRKVRLSTHRPSAEDVLRQHHESARNVQNCTVIARSACVQLWMADIGRALILRQRQARLRITRRKGGQTPLIIPGLGRRQGQGERIMIGQARAWEIRRVQHCLEQARGYYLRDDRSLTEVIHGGRILPRREIRCIQHLQNASHGPWMQPLQGCACCCKAYRSHTDGTCCEPRSMNDKGVVLKLGLPSVRALQPRRRLVR
mmetsp:Transcript_89828/g.259034  ORF Transcript_89828/g.259034 Transcript_89828/m.259034 type:complete len:242 (+) Transcript_89828:243-968(+)